MLNSSRDKNARHAPVSYTHLRAHETDSYLVCRLLLEKKKKIARQYVMRRYNMGKLPGLYLVQDTAAGRPDSLVVNRDDTIR